MELGTERIRKLLVQYAVPAIIAMTASSLYNMVDSIFIGHGVGALANAAVFRKYPDIAREKAIEEKDERNVAILDRAKAKALDMMFYVFGALMVSLALMGADIGIVLLLVAAYLFVAGCMVYYMCKYQKEM